MSEKEIVAQTKEERRKQAELELLIGNNDADKNTGTREGLDSRFSVQEGDFAVDPTHKEYRKVVQGHNKIVKRPKKY